MVKAVHKSSISLNLLKASKVSWDQSIFISHIQDLARPLNELSNTDKATGKTVPFQWSGECEKAFPEIKRNFSEAPVLQPPDLTKPFFLWVDVSAAGFGAVYEQETSDGQTVPVAFASTPTSEKFATTKLEIAGLVFTLEHFEVYVLGNQVTVYTDHHISEVISALFEE